MILRILFILLICTAPLLAQAPATTQSLPEQFRVSVITLGPGSDPWERFGHNMLRIQNRATGDDVSFNWGVFDFDAGFFGRFLQGKLIYSMAPYDSEKTINAYKTELDRDIWEQELNLTPDQKRILWDQCVRDSLPQYMYYSYDYYINNCSTKVRDAIDFALAGQIKTKLSAQPSRLTYRSETNRLMSSDLILYTALNFILGHPIDRPMTVWDELFIPMRMRDRLNELTITDETGREIPIVKSEVRLNVSKNRTPPRETPPNWIPGFFLFGAALGGIIAWLASRIVAGNIKRKIRWTFLILSVFWAFLAGFGGWFMLYAWTTDHTAVRWNENILQLCPLLLALVTLIPRTLARRKNAGKMAFRLSAIALGLSVLGLLLKVLPGMYQVNGTIIAMALPANAGLALAMWKLMQLPAGPIEAAKKQALVPRKG